MEMHPAAVAAVTTLDKETADLLRRLESIGRKVCVAEDEEEQKDAEKVASDRAS